MTADDYPVSEEAIRNFELMIPDIAARATRAAYLRALADGQTVLTVESEHIVACTPDGKKIIVGDTEPRRKVPVGQIIKVRRLSETPDSYAERAPRAPMAR